MTRRAVRLFFISAFALSWGIGGVGLVAGQWWPAWDLTTSTVLYYGAAYAISAVGVAMTVASDGRSGVEALVGRLRPDRNSIVAAALVFLGYAGITSVALYGPASLGGAAVSALSWTHFASGLPLAIVRDPGPLGEEFGWRGFALPRMLEYLSPIDATVRLGLLHAFWHAPLFFMPAMPQSTVSVPLFVGNVVAIATFNTALFLRTRANLLLAILVHFLANVCGGLAADAGVLSWFFAAEAIAAAIVIAAGGLSARR
jgi:membrane protease YdiL (CAAX protease family)